jgi:hypothetical protein
MPAPRSSTLKQRANAKTRNELFGTPTVRRKIAKSSGSSSSINHGLGTMSRLPYELRQVIFEQFVPPETSPDASADRFGMDEKAPGGNNPRHTAATPTGLAALLCTSKAVSTEVKRSYQNREYQLGLSVFGIVFEGIRSAVGFRCHCSRYWRPGMRCNHCMKGLIWKVPDSPYQRPLRLCRALKGLRGSLPVMRRLHVTLTNEMRDPWTNWQRDIAKLHDAGKIWDIVQKAELAGVELRFTLELLNHGAGLTDRSLIRGVIPLRYEPKTTIKQAGPPT